MYDAKKLADYVLYKSNELGRPISNLQLQKILYFMWIDYYRYTQTKLFHNAFYAWQFGPVVLDVYSHYKKFGNAKIIKPNTSFVFNTEADNRIVDESITKYSKYTAFELVRMSHDNNGAWAKTFRNGLGNNFIIPFELIQKTKK